MIYNKKQLQNIKYNLERYCKPFTEKDRHRYNDGEKLPHNNAISDHFNYLKSARHCVAVRPTLLTGEVPDLLILDLEVPIIKEILCSETDKRYESKSYMNIQKIKVRVKCKQD